MFYDFVTRFQSRRPFFIVGAISLALMLLLITGGYSAWTSASSDSGASVVSAAMPTPTAVSASVSGCNVNVSWTGSSATDANGGNLVQGYNILRATSSAGPYTKVGSVSGASTTSYTDTPGGCGGNYQPSWEPVTFTGNIALNDISCISGSFCASVGNLIFQGRGYGVAVLQSASGTTINSETVISPFANMSIVSCTSISFCLAIGNNGTSYGYTTYNGTSWATSATISLTNIAKAGCLSTTFCYLLGSTATSDYVGLYNGTTWTLTSLSSTAPLSDISCESSSLCIATTNSDFSIYGGSSWSTLASVGITMSQASLGTNLAVCFTATDCIAAGGSSGQATVATYNGSSWSADILYTTTTSNFASLACPSSSFCIALADVNNINEAAFYTGSWLATSSWWGNSYGGDILQCASTGYCAFYNENGSNTYLYTWTSGTTFGSANIGSALVPDAITCFPSTCVSTVSAIYELYDGSISTISNTFYIGNLSCVSTTSCFSFTVDDFDTFSISGTTVIPETSIYEGFSLSGITYGITYPLYCYSSTLCFGIFNTAIYTYSSGTWTPTTISGATSIQSISCLSATNCWAVGNNTTGGGLVVQYNGTSWGTPSTISNSTELYSISCVSTACNAVGTNGSTGITTQYTPGGGWLAGSAIALSTSLNYINCVSATFCASEGSNTSPPSTVGAIYSSGWPSSATELSTTNAPTGISCITTTWCVASIDSNATTVIYNGAWSIPDTQENLPFESAIVCLTINFCIDLYGIFTNSTSPGTETPLFSYNFSFIAPSQCVTNSGYPPIDSNANSASSTPSITNLVTDSYGNLIFETYYASCSALNMYAQTSGTYFGISMTQGNVYTIATISHTSTCEISNPISTTGLSSVASIAVDSHNNLVFVPGISNCQIIYVMPETTGTYYSIPMTAGNVYNITGAANNTGPTCSTASTSWSAAAGGGVTYNVVTVDSSGNIVVYDNGCSNLKVYAVSSNTYYNTIMSTGNVYTIAGDNSNNSCPCGSFSSLPDTSNSYYNIYSLVSGTGYILVNYATNVYIVPTVPGIYFSHSLSTSGFDIGVNVITPYSNTMAIDSHGNAVLSSIHLPGISFITATTGSFWGNSFTADTLTGVGSYVCYNQLFSSNTNCGGNYLYPYSIAIDNQDNIFVVDNKQNSYGDWSIEEIAGPNSSMPTYYYEIQSINNQWVSTDSTPAAS